MILTALSGAAGPVYSDPLNKIELLAGGYSMSAKSRRTEGAVSGFGSYRAAFRRTLLPQLEASLSYSLFTSEITGGDLGFGPEVGVIYYPFSEAQATQVETANVNMHVTEIWRPFVAGAFHQRQFQSVNSSYAGFSAAIGTEWSYRPSFSIKGEVRYMYLSGPSEGEATFLDALFGLVLPF